jgi:ABC-2 type transport system permease protein
MIAFLRFEITRTLRNARFLIMLIVFPLALYLIYGTQKGTTQNLAVGTLVLVSMAVYSGMGSAMFATGPQLARERQSGWMRQLRVSPISTPAWFGVKLAQAILMIIPGLAVLLIAAFALGHVHLSATRLGLLVGVLVAGAIPFCMLGMVIGLVFDGQAAQIAQMITLIALAFLGGIFIPWSNLPGGAQMVGKALPSYHLAQLGWDSAGGFALHASDAMVLAAWAAGLAAIAMLRWRQEATATA